MRPAAIVAAIFLMGPGATQAHVVIPGVGGFEGGVLHPMLVLSHALALIALGLLLGAQPARTRLWLIAAFVFSMALSFELVSLTFATVSAELATLLLAAITGLLLASGWKVPSPAAALLSLGLGAAILFDSVPAVPTVRETVITLCGTALSSTALIAVAAFLSAALPAFWQRIGIRVAGSWIAASAILVLALRLAKL
jgi:urease accessory protein